MRKLVLCSALISLLCSCSNDSNTQQPATDYFPMLTGNYWTYDVAGQTFSGRDSLYVSGDTVVNGNTYKKFKAKGEPLGFYTNSANNNAVRKHEDKILITGTAGFNLGEAVPVDLQLTDFVIFRESASENQVLDSKSGVIQQDFQQYPLTITYTLKTTAGQAYQEFTVPGGDAFSNVKVVNTALTLKMTTIVELVPGFPQTVVLLNTQNVVTSHQYYAKNIGMIFGETTISYELEQLPVETGFPSSYTETHTEKIDTYQVD